MPFGYVNQCTEWSIFSKVPSERKVQPMVLDSSGGQLNKIGPNYCGPFNMMNRLAVSRSARAKQVHKVNKNTIQLIPVGTCLFKVIDTH